MPGQDRPVTGIPWYEVCGYCEWLRDSTELPFRLPTEKERAGVVGEAQAAGRQGSAAQVLVVGFGPKLVRRYE